MTTPAPVIVDRLATPAEHRALCTAVGWAGVMNLDAAEDALAGSLFGVVALEEGQVVAMGRAVGDGAMFFYLQDIAVDPAWQGRGIGRRVVERLIAQVRARAPGPAFVGLFATEAARTLYARLGFAVHQELIGMFQVAEPERSTAR